MGEFSKVSKILEDIDNKYMEKWKKEHRFEYSDENFDKESTIKEPNNAEKEQQ